MSAGKILFAEQDGIYFIQLQGSVRYSASQGLGKLIDRIAGDEEAREVVVDLTQAEYLDSTNLGLLAKTANVSLSRFGKQPLLVSGNTDINMVLKSMGFEHVFQIVSDWAPSSFETADITTTTADAHLLLDAHRYLSSLNEKNAETFRDVIELLEAEQSSPLPPVGSEE